jgi:hypothetical protein
MKLKTLIFPAFFEIAAILIATLAAFVAHASSELELISGGITVTVTSGSSGGYTYSGSVGAWSLNVATGSIVGSDGMDLTSLDATSSGTSSPLIILWSTSFASAVSGWCSAAVGGTLTTGVNFTVSSYYGSSLLSTANPLTAPVTFAGSPFSGNNLGMIAATATYLTQEVVISNATAAGSEVSFDFDLTPTTPPLLSAATSIATGITVSSATLNGTVIPNGLATTAYFQWGTTTNYGNATQSQSLGSGNTAINVNVSISGLISNTIYHFQMVGQNSTGTAYGGDQTFTTLPPPSPVTGAATGITASSVTLNGNINPNGLSTTAYFEWGTNTSYGNTTPSPSISCGSGILTIAVSAALSNLAPNTPYHFQLVGQNASGAGYGGDETFTTQMGSAGLADNFTSDTSLNPNLWVTQSSILTSLARASSSPSSTLLNPTLSFGSSGMQMSGVNADYQLTGIQSLPSFTPPFSINTTVMGTVAHGNPFYVYLVNSNLTDYFSLAGNLNPSSGVPGFWIDYPTAASLSSLGISIYSNPTIDIWYTVEMAVDTNGNGACAITANGNLLVSESGFSVGTGPFYLVLAQREGLPDESGTNVALWQSVYENSGAGITAATVTTGSAISVAATSATLSGSVNPNSSLSTTAWFQWGTTTNYGNITPSQSIGSGTTTINIYALNVSGLAANTTYYFRCVASSSAGTAYGSDQTFTTTSNGAPLPIISPTYSTLMLTPTSQPADGTSKITATATLRDLNDHPVTNRTVRFSATGRANTTIATPTVTTDNNGVATTTITAATPGTSTFCLIDPANVNLISTATATFTPLTVSTPPVLSNMVTTLYQDSANFLDGTIEGFNPSITSVPISVVPISLLAPSEGYVGNYFQNQATTALAEGIVDGIFGALGTASDVNSLLNPAVGQLTAFQRVVQAEVPQLDNLGVDLGLQQFFDSVATNSNGCSYEAQGILSNSISGQQGLQKQEFILLDGIPQSSVNYATSWTSDLQSRLNANHVLMGIAAQQGDYLLVASNAWQISHNPVLSLEQGGVEAIVIGAIAAAQLAPGVDVAVDLLLLGYSEYQDEQSYTGAQNNYSLAALHILPSCFATTEEIYSNTVAGFSQIGSGSAPNTVIGQIQGGYTVQLGYESEVPLSWLSLNGPSYITVITNVYSMVEVQNIGPNIANFEIAALYSYSNNIFGALPSTCFAQLSNLPAGQSSWLQLEYFDGSSGGLPNTADPIQVYLLGINNAGIFYGGLTNFIPSTFELINEGQMEGIEGNAKNPLPPHGGPEVTNNTTLENPIRCQVVQNISNQTYQATIQISNPFNLPLLAGVTQPILSGMDILATDGTNETDAIVWTNTVYPTNIIEHTFVFSLSVTPGAQTNLPLATLIFNDNTGTNSASFQGIAPSFNGLLPVQVSSSIPTGTLGIDSTMLVAVTNLTGVVQSGSFTVAITDSSGNAVTNFTESLSLGWSDSTNFSFILPGSLAPGSYSVTGSLSIDGGTGQVFAGNYVVPSPPVAVNVASNPAFTTNGLNLALQGPAGNYLIEASSDITNPTNWQPILFYSTTNMSFYYNFTVPPATNANQQFYRAVME